MLQLGSLYVLGVLLLVHFLLLMHAPLPDDVGTATQATADVYATEWHGQKLPSRRLVRWWFWLLRAQPELSAIATGPGIRLKTSACNTVLGHSI